jgi:hypothetical protein
LILLKLLIVVFGLAGLTVWYLLWGALGAALFVTLAVVLSPICVCIIRLVWEWQIRRKVERSALAAQRMFEPITAPLPVVEQVDELVAVSATLDGLIDEVEDFLRKLRYSQSAEESREDEL